MLLASVLLVLSFVDATPLLHRRSPYKKFITLPLKRSQYERKDLHPRIVSEQMANRGLSRLARMSGGPEPPFELLERNLMRAVLSVEGVDGLEKRFNRRSLDDVAVLDKRYNTYGVPARHLAQIGDELANASGDSQASPPEVTPADFPTGNNSLGLNIQADDISYFATVVIGTPPRNFSILMDTGSADFWVGSETCVTLNQLGTGCGNHNFLGPRTSSSFVNTGNPFAVDYGSGNVSGTIIQDDITIAGLTLSGHTFGVANVESVQFSDNSIPYDGLMGLAQSTLSQQQTLTPVEALAKAGLIDAAIMGYKLGTVSDNNNDGEVTFGGFDSSKFDSSTVTTFPNVNQNGFWEGKLDDVSVGGQSLNFQGRTAVLDTGTSLAIIPQKDVITLLKQVPGAAFIDSTFTVPCNTTTVVSLTFGGRAFNINPQDLAVAPIEDGSQDCLSGILAGNFGSPTQWLVGDTFLKNVYYITNVGENTISLANLV